MESPNAALGVEQNERRADTAYAAIQQHTDQNYRTDGRDGIYLDGTDLIADVLHLLVERYGFDEDEVVEKARMSFHGDVEDGAPARAIGYAAELGDPPVGLADAWQRYQTGEDVEGHELRALDEWRGERAEELGL